MSSLSDSSFEACSLAEAVSDDAEVRMGSTSSYTVITCFDDVSRMRGKVTNGSTIESTTWDATRSVAIPGRPTATATTRDGIRPKHRVIRRVRTGCTGRRISYGPLEVEEGWGGGLTEVDQWMKPSDTICAARVAIIDELWPAARSASANNVAAAVPAEWSERGARDISGESRAYRLLDDREAGHMRRTGPQGRPTHRR